MTVLSVLGIGLVVVIVGGALMALPDVARYLRITRM